MLRALSHSSARWTVGQQVSKRLLSSSSKPAVSVVTIAQRTSSKGRVQNVYRQQRVPPEHESLPFHVKAALVASSIGLASVCCRDTRLESAQGNDKNDDEILDIVKRKLQRVYDSNIQSLPLDFQQQLNAFFESGATGQMSVGFGMGACSGFALKKVSKVGAVALGTLFVLFQCASYTGYINVNYKKIECDITEFLDLNADGKLDSQDVNTLYERVMKVLEYNLPAGSGYTPCYSDHADPTPTAASSSRRRSDSFFKSLHALWQSLMDDDALSEQPLYMPLVNDTEDDDDETPLNDKGCSNRWH